MGACDIMQIAKISDFGLSSRLLGDATHRSTQTTGTISHTAPEVLHTGRVTSAADVYSFGIMSELVGSGGERSISRQLNL